jgi:hypothetical protein
VGTPWAVAEDEPRTEELRREQAERERDERSRERRSGDPDAKAQHARRADKAAYLEDKLAQAREADRRARE